MKETEENWKLKYPVAVSDNAANVVSAYITGHNRGIGCFPHTLNLAIKYGLAI